MAVKSCVICGFPIQVSGMETQATCKQCGSIYDVIHGSLSPVVSLTAEKKETKIRIYLWNEDRTERMENKTVKVGDKIWVDTGLFTTPWSTTLSGKLHIVYHRVNEGEWKTIVYKVAPENWTETLFTIKVAGKHSFYAEFPGDDEYLGCPSKIHGMLASAHYGVSPEVSVTAAPALMVLVKNMVTGKPVSGASVVVNGFEAVTDETGVAVFEIVPPGSYAIRVTAPGYIESSKRVELTEAGAVVEISLMPIWVIPTGVAAVGGLILVGTKAMKWW